MAKTVILDGNDKKATDFAVASDIRTATATDKAVTPLALKQIRNAANIILVKECF